MKLFITRAFAFLIFVISLVVNEKSSLGDLVGYQAIYKMKLDKASTKSRFSAIQGSALSVLERNCGGWRAKEEMVVDFHTKVGGVIRRDLKFEAWEALDGLSYEFSSVAETNGVVEKYKGSASKYTDKPGEAVYQGTTSRSFKLPVDTVFYTGLVQWLLVVAESGAQHGEKWIFDGIDNEGPEKVVAFILDAGNQKNQDLHPEFGNITSGRRWTVQLAFYKPGFSEGLPEYEMEIGMVENGILTGFRIHFDDFTVLQTLEDVLIVDAKTC
ncbi:MAG: hypothetical protein CFH06_01300 [Alphaproteobacteria bacterium MarineAlpha3_Bin5]|nr:hypothetical protein [Magnetovibrio sp.]PPR77387.1 MAG: hypothetical protein CFH06_01300 [Alphaproteobacteria bacterium MarineAlpha3_Bin5]